MDGLKPGKEARVRPVHPITGLLIAVLAASSGNAQPLVRSGDFLATAGADPAVVWVDRDLDFRQQSTITLPLLERVELRTETDRFEWRRQEYVSRFSFNSLQEKKRLEQYMDREADFLAADREAAFEEALAERYAVLAEYRRIRSAIALQEQLLRVYEDRILVLEQWMEQGVEVQPDRLIRAELDRDELMLRQMEDAAELDVLRAIIGGALAPEAGWQLDTQGQIRPAEMRQILSIPTPGLAKPAVLVQQEAAIARLDAEYQWEKAQASRVLDFAQIRYADRPTTGYPGDISIGLGLQLPYRGSRKVKKAEIAMEENAAALELAYLQEHQTREIALQERRFAALEDQYQELERQIATSAHRRLADPAAALDREGILALLELREARLKRQLRLEETAGAMTVAYLELLGLQGRLAARPLLNYLRADLAPY